MRGEGFRLRRKKNRENLEIKMKVIKEESKQNRIIKACNKSWKLTNPWLIVHCQHYTPCVWHMETFPIKTNNPKPSLLSPFIGILHWNKILFLRKFERPGRTEKKERNIDKVLLRFIWKAHKSSLELIFVLKTKTLTKKVQNFEVWTLKFWKRKGKRMLFFLIKIEKILRKRTRENSSGR